MAGCADNKKIEHVSNKNMFYELLWAFDHFSDEHRLSIALTFSF